MERGHETYLHFTSRSRLDKSINTLLGIVEGISIDSEINPRESAFLQEYINDHEDVIGYHPFNELIPVVQEAIADGLLDPEERRDIEWLCEKFKSNKYYDFATVDIQRLHAILGGILADGVITENELAGLSAWLTDHDHLKSCYPYDEVDSIVMSVMSDGKIDPLEQQLLKEVFSEFMQVCDDNVIKRPPLMKNDTLSGLCASCPEIVFEESWFCFTGASARYKRKHLANIVKSLGGRFTNSIRKDLDYLVIGADGNPCWAYACYGRKVEAAVELRKGGSRLQIVHENDFRDAVFELEGGNNL